ncbi:unnamed protein product, partial [Rotaria sp. Silwood2]
VITSENGKDASVYFVAPTMGQSVPLAWTQNAQLAIAHMLSGLFQSALCLLQDQVGTVCFDKYKQLFVEIYSRPHAAFTTLPLLPVLYTYRLRNWFVFFCLSSKCF